MRVNYRLKLYMMLHKLFGYNPKKAWEKSNVSRATFYRYKKRVSGKK